LRPANILSISQTSDNSVLEAYMTFLDICLKEHEVDCLKNLCNALVTIGAPIDIFDGYYLDYEIPQISKEFDLLRIGSNKVIDIEIKTEATAEKVKKQLLKNKYYLTYLNRPIELYAYVESQNILYFIDENDYISQISLGCLVKSLSEQVDIFTGNLDELFNPSNYLVSPFNSTHKFVEGKYFLTGQQASIESQTDTLFAKADRCIISIEGKPGTGKTLWIYHYAKRLMDKGNRVLIIHTGNLNDGQRILREEYEWQIYPVKSTSHLLAEGVDHNGSKYDCIIVDETQRINIEQLHAIFDFIDKCKIKCIIGFDRAQVLCGKEITSNVVPLIESKRNRGFKLTEKIRTNKEIAYFIKAMFDLKKTPKGRINNVSVIHFADYATAKSYIDTKEDYHFISYTPSQYYHNEIDDLLYCGKESAKETAHYAVGQEFDNVITVIDSIFCYDDKRVLQSRSRGGNPYNQVKMLFQAVTRVRRKLEIVVINNPPVFKELLLLLTGDSVAN
jgi:DNA transposition AAA+ family ATPase